MEGLYAHGSPFAGCCTSGGRNQDPGGEGVGPNPHAAGSGGGVLALFGLLEVVAGGSRAKAAFNNGRRTKQNACEAASNHRRCSRKYPNTAV